MTLRSDCSKTSAREDFATSFKGNGSGGYAHKARDEVPTDVCERAKRESPRERSGAKGPPRVSASGGCGGDEVPPPDV